MEGEKGFTLLELLIVLCIVGILSAAAWPQVGVWQKEAEYRRAARALASAMREARTRAISSNLQHRVEVDLDKRRFRIVHGNRAFHSTNSSWNYHVVLDWYPLPAEPLRANSNCEVASGIIKISFNPFGSSNAQYLCVMDEDGQRHFRVGVGYSATGQVKISR